MTWQSPKDQMLHIHVVQLFVIMNQLYFHGLKTCLALHIIRFFFAHWLCWLRGSRSTASWFSGLHQTNCAFKLTQKPLWREVPLLMRLISMRSRVILHEMCANDHWKYIQMRSSLYRVWSFTLQLQFRLDLFLISSPAAKAAQSLCGSAPKSVRAPYFIPEVLCGDCCSTTVAFHMEHESLGALTFKWTLIIHVIKDASSQLDSAFQNEGPHSCHRPQQYGPRQRTVGRLRTTSLKTVFANSEPRESVQDLILHCVNTICHHRELKTQVQSFKACVCFCTIA